MGFELFWIKDFLRGTLDLDVFLPPQRYFQGFYFSTLLIEVGGSRKYNISRDQDSKTSRKMSLA